MCNHKAELLFLISEKEGKLQAEMPGGKPEPQDLGNSKATALRELEEETGIKLDEYDLAQYAKTTGGATGFPSIQYFSVPRHPDSLTIKPREKFTHHAWSKIEKVEGHWHMTFKDQLVPVRKFNHIVISAHESMFYPFIVDDEMPSLV